MEEVTSFNRQYINYDVQKKTSRVRLFGQGSFNVNRHQILHSFANKGINDIQGLYKAEDPFEWYVVFESSSSYKLAIDTCEIQISKDVKATISAVDEVIQIIRFLWVPIYVDNNIFKDYLEHQRFKFTVKRCETVYDKDDGTYNGTHMFWVKGRKTTFDSLPHILNFCNYGFQSLVMVQGRPPMCLKCKTSGHLRSSCPMGRQQPPRLGYGYGPPSQSSARPGTSGGDRRWETPRQQQPLTPQSDVDDDRSSLNETSDDENAGLSNTLVAGAVSEVKTKTVVETSVNAKDDKTQHTEQGKNNDKDSNTSKKNNEKQIKKKTEKDNDTNKEKADEVNVIMNSEGDIIGTQPCNVKNAKADTTKGRKVVKQKAGTSK